MRPGFSLIELVIVVVIIGTLAAIAVPRLTNASQRSAAAARTADAAVLQRAIDLYTAEHMENSPAIGPTGPSSDAAEFIQRLMGRSLLNGKPDAAGAYGPYLRQFPTNPVNGLATLRIGGAAAGANTHGWRFDPTTSRIEPDDGKTDSGDLIDPDGGGKSKDFEIGGDDFKIID